MPRIDEGLVEQRSAMANDQQLDIREIGPETWRLEFPYNADFIEFIKRRVPHTDRSYDSATNFWTVRGDKYMPAIEGVGVQKFRFATKIFKRGDDEVWKNLITGAESIQKSLF
ncbi:MAG: hypothetical protein ACRDQZ_09195 [Mycobacteriales bacterium]